MLKKVFLVLIVFFSFFSIGFAQTVEDAQTNLENAQNDYNNVLENGQSQETSITQTESSQFDLNTTYNEQDLSNAQSNLESAQQDLTNARNAECDANGTCIDRVSFMVPVGDFSPIGSSVGGNELSGKNSQETLNILLGTTIQKLMIAFGVLALLIMTIGAGFMIFYHGQDELLSKGKTIFSAGIIALFIALGSYFLVALVRYILFA